MRDGINDSEIEDDIFPNNFIDFLRYKATIEYLSEICDFEEDEDDSIN